MCHIINPVDPSTTTRPVNPFA